MKVLTCLGLISWLFCTSLHAQTLSSLQQSYDKAVAEKATSPFQAAVAELNAKYSAALDRLTAAATQAGNLDEAIALRDEKKLLLPDGTIPDDSENTPASLKNARSTYRQQITSLKAARDAATQPLTDHFRTLLQNLLTQTTQAGKLDEAILIREMIAALTGPAAGTTRAVVIPSAPRTSESSELAPSSSAKDQQTILQWCIKQGARVRLKQGGKIVEHETLKTIPQGNLSILRIINYSFTGGLSFPAPTAVFPWKALRAGACEIEDIEIRSDSPLDVGDVEAIGSLSKLTNLKIKIQETAPGIFESMPLMPALRVLDFKMSEASEGIYRQLLSKCPNLIEASSSCRIKDSATGAQLGELNNLQTLNLRYDGDSPEVFTGLAAASNLTHLMIFEGEISDAITTIGKLKHLEALILHSPTPDPLLMDTLVAMPQIRCLTISLEGRQTTDIEKLLKLKDIEILRVRELSDNAEQAINVISRMKSLRFLSIDGEGVRDSLVSPLKELKRLQELCVEKSPVGTDTLNSLLKTNPKLKIVAKVQPW